MEYGLTTDFIASRVHVPSVLKIYICYSSFSNKDLCSIGLKQLLVEMENVSSAGKDFCRPTI